MFTSYLERSTIDGPAAAARFVDRYVEGRAPETAGHELSAWLFVTFSDLGLGEAEDYSRELMLEHLCVVRTRVSRVGCGLILLGVTDVAGRYGVPPTLLLAVDIICALVIVASLVRGAPSLVRYRRARTLYLAARAAAAKAVRR